MIMYNKTVDNKEYTRISFNVVFIDGGLFTDRTNIPGDFEFVPGGKVVASGFPADVVKWWKENRGADFDFYEVKGRSNVYNITDL